MDNEKDENRDNTLIREFAESSKGLNSPAGLRESNRRRIEDALRSGSREERRQNWLRRRISVPLPVAAGFLLVFCLQLSLQCFKLTAYFKTPKETVSDKTRSTGLVEEPLQLHYSEQSVYVAGMGFAEKLKNYAYLRETNHEAN